MATPISNAADVHRVMQESCDQHIRHGRYAEAEALIDLADTLGWVKLARAMQITLANKRNEVEKVIRPQPFIDGEVLLGIKNDYGLESLAKAQQWAMDHIMGVSDHEES